MYLESVLLSVMSTRIGYNRIKSSVKLEQLAKTAQNVIKALHGYYRKYDHDTLVRDTFKMHFYSMQKQKIEDAELPVYDKLIDYFSKEVDDATVSGIVYQLKELDLATQTTELLQQYDRGEEVNVFDSLRASVSEYERELRCSDNIEVTASIEEILLELEHGTSFYWTNAALKAAIPDMRTGDQLIFAARPGTGKTSFLLHEVARMAPSIPDDRPIAWFCNEGKGNKIRLSKYRTLTGCTTAELAGVGGDACRQMVEEAGAGEQRFRIFDVHGKNVYDLENIIQDIKPCIVIWDMLDNVKGFRDEARTDLRLEELYKWARDAAVIYDFLSLATSQTSMDAEGLPFPTQDMLKDSKTGKQGACDAIIIMGKDNNPSKINSRFLNIAKAWKGSPEHGADPTARCELSFDGARCLFGVPVPHAKPNYKERT